MKKAAIFLLLLYNSIVISAQQDLGIRNSNYAGVQSVTLNPSAIADSKLKWDVNVFAENTVYNNTFLYIPRDSMHIFGFKSIITDIINEQQFLTRYDPQHPNELYNVTFSNEVLGPSFMLSIGNHSAIGFTTAQRVYGNINSITGNFGQNAFVFLQDPTMWDTTFHDNTARLNSMGWLEYGLSYATTIYAKGRNELKAGITIKYLQGIAAAYFKNTDLTYNIQNTKQFTFTNSSINYGRTDYNSLVDSKGINDLINGQGIGGNIGFTYVRLKDLNNPNYKNFTDSDENNYMYRIGLSIIDLGSIDFNKNSASFHLQANNANYSNWKGSHIYTNAQFDKILSAVFYQNDSTKSLVSNHFNMSLPAAISLQADWNVYKNFFLNATIIQSLNHKNNIAVIRPDVYSITPRYEKKWLELSMPLSLLYYGQWQPRFGLAVRAGWFFIGGDAIGGLLKLNDFEGADFYVGIHFFITKKKQDHHLAELGMAD
jgi:hypothetical protein